MAKLEPDLRLALIGEAAKNVELWEHNKLVVQNRLRALNARFDGNPLMQLSAVYSKLEADLTSIESSEHDAIKFLEESVKQHSGLAEWIDNPQSMGVGYKSIGRVLGLLGDPRVKPAIFDKDGTLLSEPRPRRMSDCVAYAGLAPRKGTAFKRKDMTQEESFKPNLRTKLWVVSKSVEKQSSGAYRMEYDQTKFYYQDAVHEHVCRNHIVPSLTGPKGSNGCGTQAHPEWGAVGSPLRPGHIRARALRAVMIAVLKDLYLVCSGQEPVYGHEWIEQ